MQASDRESYQRSALDMQPHALVIEKVPKRES
jgi:hypothetical protein